MDSFHPLLGVASAPEDGRTLEELVSVAAKRPLVRSAKSATWPRAIHLVLDQVASRAFRAGRLTEALSALERQANHHGSDAVLRAELCTFLGTWERLHTRSAICLAEPRLAVALRSRCMSVLSACQADQGDLETALASGQLALNLADDAKDPALAVTTAALLLERSCDRTGFDASLPMAVQVRRRAMRCTDLQVRATVHLTFGRLEGRVGHFHTALRHFAIGRRLLLEDHNEWIASAIDLDESSVLSLLGDVPGALELARRAAKAATRSGWAKGKSIAALNIAQFLVSLGKLSEVESHVLLAEQGTFRTVVFDVALADTRAQLALCRGQDDLAERTLLEAKDFGSSVPAWHQLTNDVTRNRLLLQRGRFHEALPLIRGNIKAAQESGYENLIATFRMQEAEAALGLGDVADANRLSSSHDINPRSPLSVIGGLSFLRVRHSLQPETLLGAEDVSKHPSGSWNRRETSRQNLRRAVS